MMKWEVTLMMNVEANNFFDAVEEAKKLVSENQEVISVCPCIEEEYTQ